MHKVRGMTAVPGRLSMSPTSIYLCVGDYFRANVNLQLAAGGPDSKVASMDNNIFARVPRYNRASLLVVYIISADGAWLACLTS
jgi:hypothetical protein